MAGGASAFPLVSPLALLIHVLLGSSLAFTFLLFCDGSLFGFHPTAAVAAFFFLMGEGVLLLHSASASNPKHRKFLLSLHALLQGAAFASAAAAATAIFINKEHLARPHLASRHSWVGLASLLLAAGVAAGGAVVQYGAGVVPGALRAAARQAHTSLGILPVLAGAAACVSGLRLGDASSPVFKGAGSYFLAGLLVASAVSLLVSGVLKRLSTAKLTDEKEK